MSSQRIGSRRSATLLRIRFGKQGRYKRRLGWINDEPNGETEVSHRGAWEKDITFGWLCHR